MLNKTINLRRCFRVLCCLLALGQVAACQSQEQEELRGSLYFGAGEYLAELDLRRGSVNIETSLGDVEIREISAQQDKRLLLTVFGNVDREDRHSLVLYDLDTRQSLAIAYGRNGHYLPGTGILVYDDGIRLILAEREDENWQKTEVLRHPYNATLQVMPVSATRFLYEIAGQSVHVYDIVSRRAIELDALSQRCRLGASLWDPQRERLLCRRRLDDGRFDYVMVSLDGAVAEALPLPGSRLLQPVAFLPDQDALVFTERWKSGFSDRHKYAVWIYRLDDGEFYRLVENQHLGRSVVYRPR